MRQAPRIFNHRLLRHRLSNVSAYNLDRDPRQLLCKNSPLTDEKCTKHVDYYNSSKNFDNIENAMCEIADSFAERLSLVNRKFKNALIWGYRPELLIKALNKHQCLPESYILAGTTTTCLEQSKHFDCEPNNSNKKAEAVTDLELIPFANNSFDLALCFCNLHWVNDLPGVMAQIQMSLKPDGLFQAVIAAGDSLLELRKAILAVELKVSNGAAARVAPFLKLHDGASLLQRTQYALSVADVENLQLNYPSYIAAINDLRQAGLAHFPASPPTSLNRKILQGLEDASAPRQITLELMYMSGWRPAASQQKPLKRGSAQKLLADYL